MTRSAAADDDPQRDMHHMRAMRDAYGASAGTWAEGPAVIYRALAEHLVRHAPLPLAGRTLVDLGAGTGVLSDALATAGAQVIAIDLAHGMLAHDRVRRPPAAAGDATALPLRDDAVDGVGAAFSLTHVPGPERALAEIRRVTRPGGCLLAISYHADNDHPVKVAADRAAAAHGFRPPSWHGAIKQGTEPAFADPASVVALLSDARFTAVDVTDARVDLGMADPRALVDWRLGMASLAPFVASLAPAERAALVEEALEELGPTSVPYRPHVIVATAVVP